MLDALKSGSGLLDELLLSASWGDASAAAGAKIVDCCSWFSGSILL